MTRPFPFASAYSILAPPILWFAHFFVVYAIAEFGCRANFNNWLFITPATITLLTIVITVIALVLVGISGMIAYRRWTTLNGNQNTDDSLGERERFLVGAALFLNGLFLFSIIVTALPALFLSACDWVV